MKPRSPSIDYYGFPIYYRFENRKSGRAVSLCLYDTWSNPRNPKKYADLPLSVPKDLQDVEDDEILQAVVVKYLKRVFPAPFQKELTQKQMALRTLFFPRLPLGIIVQCDFDAVLDLNKWTDSYRIEMQRAAVWLTEQFGSLTLAEAVPETIAENLPHESHRKTESVVRAIRFLYHFESSYGLPLENPWIEYSDQLSKRQKSKNAGRRNAEYKSFSPATYSKLINYAVTDVFKNRDPKVFALLLFLTTPLSAEEICALRYGDFTRLRYYSNCMVIKIERTYTKEKKAKLSRLIEITDPYHKRIVPLATTVAKAFELLPKAAPEVLLIHHPNNPRRHMPADKFKAYVCSLIIQKAEDKFIDPIEIDKHKLIPMIKSTVFYHYVECDLEEDEISYMRGIKPQSTSGIHYCDFTAEGELNRLALMQDHWLSNYIPTLNGDSFYTYFHDYLRYIETDPPTRFTMKAKGDSVLISSEPGELLHAIVKMKIAPYDIMEAPYPLKIRISTTRGHSAEIVWNMDYHWPPKKEDFII